MSKIVAFKLSSGEELVGTFIEKESDDNFTVVENVLMVVMQRSPQGEVGIGILPFMPYVAERKLKFNSKNITVVSEVDDNMRNQYNGIFGGIVTPQKKILLG